MIAAIILAPTLNSRDYKLTQNLSCKAFLYEVVGEYELGRTD